MDKKMLALVTFAIGFVLGAGPLLAQTPTPFRAEEFDYGSRFELPDGVPEGVGPDERDTGADGGSDTGTGV